MRLFTYLVSNQPDHPVVRAIPIVRDAYLEAFVSYGSVAELREALAFAARPALLRHALSYARFPLERAGSPWERRGMVGHLLRQAEDATLVKAALGGTGSS